MVSFQMVSDLHLEFPHAYDMFRIERKAPLLALLGDIGYVAAHREGFLAFLNEHLRRFDGVFLVLGNHEPYHSTWGETIGEFRLLNQSLFRPPSGNVVFLGCSLFSHVLPENHDHVSFGLKDFYDTEDWDVASHNAAHQKDLNWLNEQVSALEKDDAVGKIAILTHWSPTIDGRASDAAHQNSSISSAFATDLSGEKCWLSEKVKLWSWGHTHYNCDFEVEREEGALRALTNQTGYYHKQSEGFDSERVFEL